MTRQYEYLQEEICRLGLESARIKNHAVWYSEWVALANKLERADLTESQYRYLGSFYDKMFELCAKNR